MTTASKPVSSLYTGRGDWETPQKLFDLLHEEFNFDLDLAASAANAKVYDYCSISDPVGEDDKCRVNHGDAFAAWELGPRTAFLNPPYSKLVEKRNKPGEFTPVGVVGEWLSYVVSMLVPRHWTVVCVLPHKASEEWFDWCDKSDEIRELRGRVHFERNGKPITRVNFGSCVVVFRRKPLTAPVKRWRWDWRGSL